MPDDTDDKLPVRATEGDGTPAEATLEPALPAGEPGDRATEGPASPPEAYFTQQLDAAFEQKVSDFSQTLNLAVVGRVSCGKSSLINALLRRDRENAIADVGAISGVTTKLNVIRLDEQVRIVDSPGLDDIRADNTKVTEDFLRHVDVGIFVVTGSADASQRRHLAELRRTCDAVFVVLNKVDDWDRHSPTALEKVRAQWLEALRVETLHATCAFGYDPDIDPAIPLDIRGVDELRDDIEAFLAARGKDLLLARHMGNKSTYAWGIVAGALTAVAGEALLPGSAAFITATQAAAVSALYYLYTGRLLSKQSALAILPSFAAEATGSTVFMWVKSILPPTGILDAAAAGVAVVITFAMLVSVNALLANGHELHERDLLRAKFRSVRAEAQEKIGAADPGDWRDPEFWKKLAHDVMYA